MRTMQSSVKNGNSNILHIKKRPIKLISKDSNRFNRFNRSNYFNLESLHQRWLFSTESHDVQIKIREYQRISRPRLFFVKYYYVHGIDFPCKTHEMQL